MWADTRQVGCGAEICGGNEVVVSVCYYLPTGNFEGESMFAETNYLQLVASGQHMERCNPK